MVAACHIIKLGNRWRRHQAHSDYDLKLDSDKQPKTAETVEDCRLQTVDCRVQRPKKNKQQQQAAIGRQRNNCNCDHQRHANVCVCACV